MANPTPRRRNYALIVIPIVLLLLPLAYSAAVAPLQARRVEAARPFLEMPDAPHTACVRPTTWMRFHHWELLRETRKAVVRYGIRNDPELPGLQRCAECHTSRERFCHQCHSAVSMTPDCWGCHYYP